MKHIPLIYRFSKNGSAYQLAIIRILISIQIIYNTNSRIFELFKIGLGHDHTETIFQIFNIQSFINLELIAPLKFIVIILSFFLLFGLFTRHIAPILSIAYLLLYSVHYSYFDAPVPWLYIWLPLILLSFSKSSDVLSIDNLISKKSDKINLNSKLYRWPVELISLWFVYIYFSAGIAKIFPLIDGIKWIEGGIIQQILYNRYLDSFLHFLFGFPFFDFSVPSKIYSLLAVVSILIELSTITILFTNRYNNLILLLILSMHSSLFLIGVPGFGILSFIIGIALLSPGYFNRIFIKTK
tara:strand:- start:2951 stop:3841 length:891 start_codon:yes stop_codon:yes gene_type:complete